jgi:membrane associated rhomboid family serine protease
MAVTAAVQLLLWTVLTSPRFLTLLELNPASLLRQPWSAVTYLFVHAGLLHLATNLLGLYLFGTAVESRMGSRPFLLYYLYCGVGAALTAAVLALVTPLAPVIGASGAVLGVAVAFAMYWPDAEIVVFPIPLPIKARTLVLVLAVLDLVAARIGTDGVAHEAHLGGMLFGWLFFRFRAFGQRHPVPERRPAEPVVMVQQTARREPEPREANTPGRAIPRPGSDPVAAEVDRVLDKISAYGIQSLTAEERRFLDEVSKRKQRGPH